MFFLYGIKAPILAQRRIPGKCVECNTDSSLMITAYQRYFDIFWIPIFPVGKVYISQCSFCRQELNKKGIETYYRAPFEDFKHTLRTPLWTFIGLGVIAFLVINLMVYSNKQDEATRTLLESPRKGDLYEYKTPDGDYSFLKVAGVSSDTVHVFPNNYSSSGSSGLRKIKHDTSFHYESYPILKKDLLEKFKTGNITKAIRE